MVTRPLDRKQTFLKGGLRTQAICIPQLQVCIPQLQVINLWSWLFQVGTTRAWGAMTSTRVTPTITLRQYRNWRNTWPARTYSAGESLFDTLGPSWVVVVVLLFQIIVPIYSSLSLIGLILRIIVSLRFQQNNSLNKIGK